MQKFSSFGRKKQKQTKIQPWLPSGNITGLSVSNVNYGCTFPSRILTYFARALNTTTLVIQSV